MVPRAGLYRLAGTAEICAGGVCPPLSPHWTPPCSTSCRQLKAGASPWQNCGSNSEASGSACLALLRDLPAWQGGVRVSWHYGVEQTVRVQVGCWAGGRVGDPVSRARGICAKLHVSVGGLWKAERPLVCSRGRSLARIHPHTRPDSGQPKRPTAQHRRPASLPASRPASPRQASSGPSHGPYLPDRPDASTCS